jgi:hypothetical protein
MTPESVGIGRERKWRWFRDNRSMRAVVGGGLHDRR